MGCKRSEIVAQAKAWLGLNEADGSHKKVIDIYNSHKPLARGYKMQCIANGDSKNDDWCSCFVSAVAIKLNSTDIIPTEVGCGKHIDLFKAMGIWVEDDAYVPNANGGDIIFYNWNDKGVGDCTSGASHVGFVEKVSGNTITVIEGNYGDAVKRRTLQVNGKYIRGYGVPKYDAEEVEETSKAETTKVETTVNVTLPVLKKGSKGEQVKALQRMLYAMGYNLGSSNPIDGDFGSKTDAAVRAYQKSKGLTVDGIVGAKTWGSLLGT